MLAYARLVNNRHDDIGFERVINTPTWHWSANHQYDSQLCTQLEQSSLWEAGQKLVKEGKLSNRAATSFSAFVNLVDELDFNSTNHPKENKACQTCFPMSLNALPSKIII
ncbi:MAG: hypothetical protein R3E90_02500 [Marinicella sp.]